jgi:hypothetical protein
MTTTVQDFFKEVYVKYKGKQSKVPALGTDKWLSAVITLQAKLREFATDPYHEWDSLHQDVNGGTVAVNNSTYDLDETIQRPSDKLVVTKNGQVTRISFIKLTQRWLPPTSWPATAWLAAHLLSRPTSCPKSWAAARPMCSPVTLFWSTISTGWYTP